MRLPMALTIILAGAVSACSLPDSDSFKGFDTSVFRPRAVNTFRGEFVRPISAEDLIDPSGACVAQVAGAPTAEPTADPSGAPIVAGGVALQMTECEVVRRNGAPSRVEVGQNEANERATTLTYIGGARPGIYRFAGGRLTVIERAPEPVAPQRPQRQQRAPKRNAPA